MKRDDDGAIVGAFDLFQRDVDGEPWTYIRTVYLDENMSGYEGMKAALDTVGSEPEDKLGQWSSYASYGEDSVVLPHA